MHRRIRTRDESMDGIYLLVVFMLVWQRHILLPILIYPESLTPTAVFMSLFGLMPLQMIWKTAKRARHYRALHKKYAQGIPRRGVIVGCRKHNYMVEAARGGSYTKADYVLDIDVYDPATPAPYRIQSEVYSWPVYRALSSPEVDVYPDQTGWHYIIDGFQYKKRRRDPDILGDKNYSFGSQAEYLYYFNRIMFTLLLISDVIYPLLSVLLILLLG